MASAGWNTAHTGATPCIFEKLLVHNDAVVCIQDGRKWGAKFFEEASAECGEQGAALCADISRHFYKVSALAEEMMTLTGDWSDMEKMLQSLACRPVREKLGRLIDAAKAEDGRALEGIRRLCDRELTQDLEFTSKEL